MYERQRRKERARELNEWKRRKERLKGDNKLWGKRGQEPTGVNVPMRNWLMGNCDSFRFQGSHSAPAKCGQCDGPMGRML